MKNFLTLLTLTIACIAFSAQFEIVKDVTQLPGDITAQQYPHKDVNGQWCAILKVHSDVKGIQFEGMGYEKSDYRDGGIYLVYMQPESKNLKLIKDGYIPKAHTFPIKLKSNAVYMMEVKGVGEEKKIEDIAITVISDPSGANIFLDEVDKGNKEQIKTSVGKHKLKLVKDGYQTKTADIEVAADKTLFKFKLDEVQDALVAITSTPSGAKVFINDIELGTTPVSQYYPEGNYRIKLTSNDYDDVEEAITIKSPQTKKSYTLTDIRSTLTINTHEKASVYINGELTSNYKNMKFSPQVINIKVEMNKAKTLEQRVILGKNENKTVDLFPVVPVGKVQIAVVPDDAEIRFSEYFGEEYTSTGSKIFTDVPVGDYNLTVSKYGYETHTESIKLSEGATLKRSIKLVEGTEAPSEETYSEYASADNADSGDETYEGGADEDGPDIAPSEYESGYDEGESLDTSGYVSSIENFVFVEGGTFEMGSNDGRDSEKPVHSVTVGDFYISKYIFTQSEFDAIAYAGMEFESSYGGDKPMVLVSWYDAVNYCNKLSDAQGLDKCYIGSGENISCRFSANGFRLPTEEEWEFAARGGNKSKGYKFSGSNDLQEVAWCEDNSNDNLQAVGKKKPNELGLYDMSGNVWEWCWDIFEPYNTVSYSGPKRAATSTARVKRGGNYRAGADLCSVTHRNYNEPDDSSSIIGFRLAMSAGKSSNSPDEESVTIPETLNQDDMFRIDNIKFSTGKAEFLESSTAELNSLKKIFDDNPYIVIRIEVHTDNRGKDSSNKELSQKRADAIMNYLIDEFSISQEQVSAVGYGENLPIATNDTEEGRARNRRIEIRVMSTE